MAGEPYRDSILITAESALVFDYFTKPEAIVRWMGDRAVLDPRPGGEFTLYFGDRCVEGRYLEIDRPRRLVIAWGRRGSSNFPPPPACSRFSSLPRTAVRVFTLSMMACPRARSDGTLSAGVIISSACRSWGPAASPKLT